MNNGGGGAALRSAAGNSGRIGLLIRLREASQDWAQPDACRRATLGLGAEGSRNGSGVAGVSMAWLLFVMEQLLARTRGQNVSELAGQKKRLLLWRMLALLPGSRENQDG